MNRKKIKKKQTKKKKAPANKEICFVIMPFGGWLDDYYQTIYSPAITAAGLEPHRADDLFRPSTIVNDIWAYTKKARILLADLTGKNPNVFYELGLAHALAKPAIIVAESMDDVPFDLRALRVLVYDKNAPDWGSVLKEKVEAAILEVLDSPTESVLPAFLDTKGVGHKPAVTPYEKELLELRQQIEGLREGLRSVDRGRVNSSIRRVEAEALVERLLREGRPENEVVTRVTALGAPRSWTEQYVRDLSAHRASKATTRSRTAAEKEAVRVVGQETEVSSGSKKN